MQLKGASSGRYKVEHTLPFLQSCAARCLGTTREAHLKLALGQASWLALGYPQGACSWPSQSPHQPRRTCPCTHVSEADPHLWSTCSAKSRCSLRKLPPQLLILLHWLAPLTQLAYQAKMGAQCVAAGINMQQSRQLGPRLILGNMTKYRLHDEGTCLLASSPCKRTASWKCQDSEGSCQKVVKRSPESAQSGWESSTGTLDAAAAAAAPDLASCCMAGRLSNRV